MFEEEYRKFAKSEAFSNQRAIDKVHKGYFSIDKRGRCVDTAENNQANRDNAERAYNLIMKDKERLLSFDTELRFIFSHSALKEGWDNPNVFQICTLRDIGSERERRQTLGRGLRLCVNQNGERLRGREVNRLTVIAAENYERFAESLQTEIERDTGIRFGIVEPHQFAAIPTRNAQGEPIHLGVEHSKKIWQFLKAERFVDDKGKIQDSLRKALKMQTFRLPGEMELDKNFQQPAEIVSEIRKTLCKLAGKLDIKNANEQQTITTREAVLKSEDFGSLWERIKHQTTYRVHFDHGKFRLCECNIARRYPKPVRSSARRILR